MQGPAIPAIADFLVGGPGISEGLVTHDGCVALQDRVELRDAIQHVVGEVYRRYFARRDEAGYVPQTLVVQFLAAKGQR